MHATTGDFIAANDWMDVKCQNIECRRTVLLHPAQILRRFPQPTPIDQARRRMKCERCGAGMPTITIKPPSRHEVDRDTIGFGKPGATSLTG